MIAQPGVKLNLGLRVLRRREDGYHDLETVFYPYAGIHDTLEIITGDDYSRTSASLFERYAPSEMAQGLTEDGGVMITIARAGGVGWDPLKDLTVKAVRLLRERFSLPALKIYLEKTSPVGAGLGGGSADGAFALRMVSDLCSLGLSDGELAGFAASLGSDCPFFVYNRPMLGTGRGEVLTPVDVDLSGYEIRVVVPEGVSVSTAEAYRGLAPLLACRAAGAPGPTPVSSAAGIPASAIPSPTPVVPSPSPVIPDLFRNLPLPAWRDHLVNDFEPSVFAAHPALAEIKHSLYAEGALYAAMSGSGSALFGIFPR